SKSRRPNPRPRRTWWRRFETASGARGRRGAAAAKDESPTKSFPPNARPIVKVPLLDQARELHWATSHNTKLLERISADVRRLADKTDTHVALAEKLHNLMTDEYVQRHLAANSKYAEPGRLGRHERQVFSQSGEDGIIEEIFARIGETNRQFIEFGVGTGVENNSAYLLVKGWKGLWI